METILKNQSMRGTVRELLTAPRTYYVRTDGSNSNNGLANTSGGAFLTVQKAVDVASSLDNSGYDVTIQIGDGTYNAGVMLKSSVGDGYIILQGNAAAPANVNITGLVSSWASIYALACTTKYRVKDLKVASSGYAISAEQGSYLEVSNIELGLCSFGHFLTRDHGRITLNGNLKITGATINVLQSNFMGMIRVTSACVITIPSALAFTAFASCTAGMINTVGTFSGAGVAGCTGTRFASSLNAAIWTNGGGANYFPGNVVGTTTTGGQYG